jgi:hypothetical protein
MILANDHDPLCPAARKADMETGGGIVMAFCACPLIAKVREDMLDRCEEAAYTDLLALEDEFREALGKGSDAARIVAGYRSVMPGFRQFYKENP